MLTTRKPDTQNDSSEELPLSTTTPTSISSEYDTSGVASIGIWEYGEPVHNYVIPDEWPSKPSSNSILVGETLALAKIELTCHPLQAWFCQGGNGRI